MVKAKSKECVGSLVPLQAIETALDCLKSANTEPYYRRQAWEVIKCFLVAMMSLDDNKHALYQLLAHPKYDNSLNVNVYVKFMVSLEQSSLETVISLCNSWGFWLLVKRSFVSMFFNASDMLMFHSLIFFP